MNLLQLNYFPLWRTKQIARDALHSKTFFDQCDFFGLKYVDVAKKLEVDSLDLYIAMTKKSNQLQPERLALRTKCMRYMDTHIDFWLNQTYGADKGAKVVKLGVYRNVIV